MKKASLEPKEESVTLRPSDKLKNAGAWFTLEGYDKKFQAATFPKLMQTDPTFSKIVYDIMDEEVIQKFENKTGNAADFYGEEEEEKDA